MFWKAGIWSQVSVLVL